MRIGQAAVVVLSGLLGATCNAQNAPRLAVPFYASPSGSRTLQPVPVPRASNTESDRAPAAGDRSEPRPPHPLQWASTSRRLERDRTGGEPTGRIARATDLLLQQDEPSPSDQIGKGSPSPGNTDAEDAPDARLRLSPPAAAVADDRQTSDILTPLQNRQLNMSVSAVNIGETEIGTGAIPQRSPFSETELGLLPDGAARGAPFKTVYWRPTCMWHFPLYYEDAMLERHGHIRFGRFQPIVSGAKFFGTIPLLPYRATLQPPKIGQYVLGNFRPGTPAPALRGRLPWDGRAAVVETLSAAGFFWGAPF